MTNFVDLLNSLELRRSAYFTKRWDRLSAEDAKNLVRLERDIMDIKAALHSPSKWHAHDLKALSQSSTG